MLPVHTTKISIVPSTTRRCYGLMRAAPSYTSSGPADGLAGPRGASVAVAPRWVDVADIHAVRRNNRAKSFEVRQRGLLLCNVDGELYAIDDVCTHDGGRLEGGRIRDCTVACPRHGARFDVRDGSVQALPAVRPVASYSVRIVDDRVEVLLPDAETHRNGALR